MATYPDNADFSTFAGRDSAGLYQSDLDPNWIPVTGPRAVLEHVARRIMTPTGSMQDEEYGFDLRRFYNASLSRLDLLKMRAAIEGEASKVEGVDSVAVTADQDASGTVRIEISVALADDETYPMVFALSVTGLSLISLLGS